LITAVGNSELFPMLPLSEISQMNAAKLGEW
jgi:hypothetical protein